MWRRRLVQFIVERGWPLALGVYCTLAAISLARGAHAFMQYTLESEPFSIIIYIIAALSTIPTAIWPQQPFFRWMFFILMGFALTGRLFQTPEDQLDIESVARGIFTFAALLAHFVIQVDWMFLRANEASDNGLQ